MTEFTKGAEVVVRGLVVTHFDAKLESTEAYRVRFRSEVFSHVMGNEVNVRADDVEQKSEEARDDCYCVCHSPYSSRPQCEHCSPNAAKGPMNETENTVRELLGMKERLRSLRDRLCDEKNNKNPRYHGFSLAISGINRAIYDMEEEERS